MRDPTAEDRSGTAPTTVPAHVIDDEGRLRFVNDAWVTFTGYDRDAVVGDPFASLLTDESTARLRSQLSGEDVTARTLSVRRADGELVPVVHDGSVERNGEGLRYHCQCRPAPSTEETESTAFLRSLVDSLPVGILAETAGREVLAVNETVLDIFGVDRTPEAAVGADSTALAATTAERFADPEQFRSGIESTIEAGDPVAGERLVRQDGRIFERSYFPVTLPAGTGHLWVYDDVTGRSRAESDLRTYERLFDVAPVGVFRTTTGGAVLSVNPKLASILGYDSVEAAVAAYEDLSTELYADPGRREAFLERLQTDGVVEDFVYQAVDADGERRWLSMNARLLPETVDGDRVVAGFTRDVTERRVRERDLETYREIVERLRDPIALQDCAGQYVLVNEALASYTDRSAAELLGTDEHSLLDRATAEEIEQTKNRVLTTEHPVESTIEPTFEAGGTRTFSTLRYPYYDAADDLAGTVAIWRDVTDQKQREQQLAVLGRILRHNLRNAMTVVRGQAETIASGSADDPQATASAILDHVDDLMTLVNKEQTVATSLQESNGRREQDVGALLESAVGTLRTRFPNADVSLTVPEDATVSVCDRFEQAVVEVLDNACRHTDTGTVEVDVSVEATTVTVAVTDDGPGMPAVERSVLEGEADITPLSHSTGIGLWLIQWLVHLSDGAVAVADADPGGTVVTLSLPRATGANDFEGVR